MSAPLISPAWHTRVIWVCALALTGFAVLAAVVANGHSTGFDTWTFAELYHHTGSGFAEVTLGLSEPMLSVSICTLVAASAALVRRWDVVVLTTVGPALTVVLTKYVFKPLLGRELGTDIFKPLVGPGVTLTDFRVTGTFPSGHESAVAATACVLVVLCFQAALSRRVRAVLLALIGTWTVIAAIGLVRNFWHYATDTIGAVCLATTVVMGLALVLDRNYPAVQQRLATRLAARRQLTRRS